MNIKMPRGALPVLRSELAASNPYWSGENKKTFGPSGQFPTPNNELAGAQPYKPSGAAPESFLAWPIEIGLWGNEEGSDSIWAEEAFAKACGEPKVLLPEDVVVRASQECGSSNFAAFLETRGFEWERNAYLDGPFYSVNWANEAVLQNAIANVGPVKIGVFSTGVLAGIKGQVTHGTSGWALYDLPAGKPEDHCASLCGYGPLAALVDLFGSQGVSVNVPEGIPSGLSYAMFSWGSIGIIDRRSLMNITGEAWIRNPTTIVRKL